MEVCANLNPSTHENILTAEDANILLQNKDSITIGNINIRGRISSFSEIFRVRKDKLYMIVLDDILKIIVMQEDYLKWHKVLNFCSEYVFISLKPATLKKGVEVPFKVFVPMSKSLIFKDIDNIKPYTLTEWLNDNLVNKEKLICEPDSKENLSLKLVSYQGMIENIVSAEFGIYNLDGKILLYTSHLPSVRRVEWFDIGTEITVHNVHHGGSKEYPRIRLYCCAKSTINIISRPSCTTKPSVQQYLESSKSWVHHMINAYSLNKKDTDLLKELFETVYNLCNLLKREKYDVIKVLQLLVSPAYCPWLQNNPRNVTQEFFLEPHECFYTDKAGESRIPTVMSVERLLELAYDGASGLSELKDKFKDSNLIGKDLCEQLYWTYKLQTNKCKQQIIIGWLELCKTTGRILLRDGHSKIDIIISSCDKGTNHICDKNCVESPAAIECPYVGVHQIGKFIVVNAYSVISERFINGWFSNIESIHKQTIDEFQHIPYLQFSALDCHILSSAEVLSKITKRTCGHSHDDVNNNKMNARKPDDAINLKRTHSPAQTVSTKCTIQTHCDDWHKIQNGRGTDVDNSQTVRISHKESLLTETKNMETRLRFSALGCIINKNNLRPTQTTKSLLDCQLDLKYEPVELVFQSDSVKWYDVIKSGTTYTFSRLCNVDYKIHASMQARVKRCTQKSRVRRIVSVPSDVVITRNISDDEIQVMENNILRTEDILSDRCKDTLVSLEGVIIGRKHCDSGLPPKGVGFNDKKLNLETQRHLSVSMIGNQCVQLQLKSVHSDAEISVYLKLERTSYPLGLIHGTVVQFERLERKVSKRGTVYCQYIPVSSHRIMYFRPKSSDSRCSQNSDIDMEVEFSHVKLQYIVENLRCKYSRSFQCICRIYQILNLRIECICCSCGSVCRNSRCSSQVCRNTSFKLVGKTSFLIDDGSTVAKAFLTLDKDKAKLFLNLDDSECESLTEEIQEIGEIYISNLSEYQQTQVAMFLQKLCNSFSVKKSQLLTLRPFYSQDVRSMSSDDLEVRHVHVGDSTVETRCLPYWTLECLHLQDVNYNTAVYNI